MPGRQYTHSLCRAHTYLLTHLFVTELARLLKELTKMTESDRITELTHSRTELTHSLTHSLTRSRTLSLTDALTYRPHSLKQLIVLLVHSLTVIHTPPLP